ncbi:MAG: flavodoxin family protein [Chloroflexi bacterium]|nr:flavodoxin family protein [Chloroflexota bacterium]
MKMLALSGSRNHQGRTAQAIDALQKGFAKGGGTSECQFLIDLKLERCRQCEQDGWGICRSKGVCIIEDDFASVVDKIKTADIVLFATPVYFADLSESMRSFLDRLRRIRFRRVASTAPGAPPQGAPGTPGVPGVQGQPAVAFCISGGGGGGSPSCMFNMERILQTCGFNIVDMILARRQNLDLKLKVLETTGEWLATPKNLVSTPPPPPAR